MRHILALGIIVALASLASVGAAQTKKVATLSPTRAPATPLPPKALPPSSGVPELDPSALGGAIFVLLGGAAVLGGRRRRSV